MKDEGEGPEATAQPSPGGSPISFLRSLSCSGSVPKPRGRGDGRSAGQECGSRGGTAWVPATGPGPPLPPCPQSSGARYAARAARPGGDWCETGFEPYRRPRNVSSSHRPGKPVSFPCGRRICGLGFSSKYFVIRSPMFVQVWGTLKVPKPLRWIKLFWQSSRSGGQAGRCTCRRCSLGVASGGRHTGFSEPHRQVPRGCRRSHDGGRLGEQERKGPRPSCAQELPEQWTNTKKLAVQVKQNVAPLQANEVNILRRKCQQFEVETPGAGTPSARRGCLLGQSPGDGHMGVSPAAQAAGVPREVPARSPVQLHRP